MWDGFWNWERERKREWVLGEGNAKNEVHIHPGCETGFETEREKERKKGLGEGNRQKWGSQLTMGLSSRRIQIEVQRVRRMIIKLIKESAALLIAPIMFSARYCWIRLFSPEKPQGLAHRHSHTNTHTLTHRSLLCSINCSTLPSSSPVEPGSPAMRCSEAVNRVGNTK